MRLIGRITRYALFIAGLGFVAWRLLVLRSNPSPRRADMASASGAAARQGEAEPAQPPTSPEAATVTPGSPAQTRQLRRRPASRKVLVALGTVLVLQCLFVLAVVSSQQTLSPRNMPFGVVGTSPVVNQVTLTFPGSLHVLAYPNQAAAVRAIDQSRIYGAYITGRTSDKVLLVPQKGFFAKIDLQAAFAATAKKLHRPLTMQTVKPLPPADPVGAVVGLLLLPLLIGSYLGALLVFKAAGAAAKWRVSILSGYAVVGALLTDLIAGPLLHAYSNSHFWPLLPAFMLITSAVTLAAAALQGLIGRLGTLLVITLFIFVGGPASGGFGTSMLPVYWQNIGAALPPQNAVTLIRNVLYFGGNNITTPLLALFGYLVAGAAVVTYLGWFRPAKPSPEQTRAGGPTKLILGALTVAAVMECLFALNYTSSGHQPAAINMPFGATGPSPILTQVQHGKSVQVSHFLQVTRYPTEPALKNAISHGALYGGLIPATKAGAPSTLLVVPSMSDLAPLNLADQFARAAITVKQPLKVQSFTPVPLAPKDPLGIVAALMIIPLLVGGYMAATLHKNATGSAHERWPVFVLTGYAVVAGLAIAIIVGYWLQGYPSASFWTVWPILSLIILAVSLIAAVLQKLLGAAGTLLALILILQLGNPSSGGANGVPYLNRFWGPLGPFLPPRNGFILLRNTVYFHGHGISQALIVLLAYLVIAGILLGLLVRFRTPQVPVTPETETDAAAVAVPVGAAP